MTSKVSLFVERARSEGVLFALLHYLSRVGVVAQPFYYMRESMPSAGPEHLAELPEGVEFSVFGRDDVLAISRLPERRGYAPERYVLDNLAKGDVCLGLKHNGRIAAFTWYSLVGSVALRPARMNDNEAYLYDMYVLKAYRGHNLAPALRYRTYATLNKMGRDTFYSVTEPWNLASIRFKEKLGARPVLLGIYFRFFGRFSARWVVRRF